MEEFNDLIVNSIDKYFTVLTEQGYSKGASDIVVLTAILYILEHFERYITEDNIRTFVNIILCINGNCIIDYPLTLSEDSLYRDIKSILKMRISLDNQWRTTENNIFRVKA